MYSGHSTQAADVPVLVVLTRKQKNIVLLHYISRFAPFIIQGTIKHKSGGIVRKKKKKKNSPN